MTWENSSSYCASTRPRRTPPETSPCSKEDAYSKGDDASLMPPPSHSGPAATSREQAPVQVAREHVRSPVLQAQADVQASLFSHSSRARAGSSARGFGFFSLP